jgi:orotidine-5'-phosphate decarboxylase
MMHFVDRVLEEIRRKGAPVCVGIDPVYDRLPEAVKSQPYDEDDAAACVDAIFQWTMGLLEAVAEHVPLVKFQSACFERYGWDGVEAYYSLIREAKEMGLVVIGDAKRGDIGTSAEHYAAGCLLDLPGAEDEQVAGPDSITVISYFGLDGLKPFTEAGAASGRGVFALVRTSNPGGDAIQSLKLTDGRSVAEAVAEMVAKIGGDAKYVGKSGYSLLGAVVGATKPEDARRLRTLMPQQMFLVPGYGAQGGSADDVRACFKDDGTGAIITASRSVIFAHEKNTSDDWETAVEKAAVQLRREIREILGASGN